MTPTRAVVCDPPISGGCGVAVGLIVACGVGVTGGVVDAVGVGPAVGVGVGVAVGVGVGVAVGVGVGVFVGTGVPTSRNLDASVFINSSASSAIGMRRSVYALWNKIKFYCKR